MRWVINYFLFLIIIISIQYAVVGQPLRHDDESGSGLSNGGGGWTNVSHGSPWARSPDSVLIDNYVNSLEKGRLIYNPSAEMTINISEAVNATITKENTSGESIKVAPYMEVNLKGLSFDIVPITEVRQFIGNDTPTVWKWDVIPRKIGNQTLDLLAYVIIEMPNGKEERRALVKSKTIHIQVNPHEKRGVSDFISDLFKSPWAKVIGALSGLLGFVAIYFKEDILAWIRSKKRSSKD